MGGFANKMTPWRNFGQRSELPGSNQPNMLVELNKSLISEFTYLATKPEVVWQQRVLCVAPRILDHCVCHGSLNSEWKPSGEAERA
eukprot:305851-Amphidinium_carterae.1